MMKVWANVCYFRLGGQVCVFCKMTNEQRLEGIE